MEWFLCIFGFLLIALLVSLYVTIDSVNSEEKLTSDFWTGRLPKIMAEIKAKKSLEN